MTKLQHYPNLKSVTSATTMIIVSFIPILSETGHIILYCLCMCPFEAVSRQDPEARDSFLSGDECRLCAEWLDLRHTKHISEFGIPA